MEACCGAGSDERPRDDSLRLSLSNDVKASCQSPQDADHFNIAPLDFGTEQEIVEEKHNPKRKLSTTSKEGKDGKSRKTAQCLAQQIEDEAGMEQKYEDIFKFVSEGEYPFGYDKSQRFKFRQSTDKFTLREGELFVGKRRVIKSEEEARRIFREFHSLPMGGHSGISKTRSAISSRFFWHKMSIDIKTWIQECVKCQKDRKPSLAPQPLQCIKDVDHFNIAAVDSESEQEIHAEKHNSKRKLSRALKNGKDGKIRETAQCFTQQIKDETGMEQKYEDIFKFVSEGEYPFGYDKSQRFNFRQTTAKFSLKEGELFVGKRRVIKSEEEARRIFREFHSSPMGGHSGISRTLLAISSRFFWHKMTIDIKNWIQGCVKCQKDRKPSLAPQPLQCIKDVDHFNIAAVDSESEQEIHAEKHNSKRKLSRALKNGKDGKIRETAQCFTQQIKDETGETRIAK